MPTEPGTHRKTAAQGMAELAPENPRDRTVAVPWASSCYASFAVPRLSQRAVDIPQPNAYFADRTGMGTLTATLLTAPMFGLKLAWAIGAPVLLLLARQAVSNSFGVAPRLCAYFTPANTSCCATAERSMR